MSEMDEPKSFLNEVIERAQRQTQADCDVIFDRGHSLSLNAQHGQIDKCSVSARQTIGLRLVKNGRRGISYSESLEPEAINRMIAAAADNMTYSDVDPDETIADTGGETHIEANARYNVHDQTSVKEKKRLSLYLESEIKNRESRAKAPYNGYADGSGDYFYMNSHGRFCAHREASVHIYTSALIEDQGRQAMYYSSRQARAFADLDVESCIRETLDHARALVQAEPVATGQYDVIFSPETLHALFSCYASAFSGKAVQEGKSAFRDRLGAVVAHPELTLTDCPSYKEGFRSVGFDDEGQLQKDLVLIRNGTLKSFYHNSATAKFFKTKSTGHASRSPKGALGISGTQWVIAPGSSAEDHLTADRYIKIINISGLHSGTNAITGEFSLGMEGYLFAHGQMVQAIRDVTVAGNFFQLLENIAGLGRVVRADRSKTFFSPTIRFRGLSIAGK